MDAPLQCGIAVPMLQRDLTDRRSILEGDYNNRFETEKQGVSSAWNDEHGKVRGCKQLLLKGMFCFFNQIPPYLENKEKKGGVFA